MVPVKVTAAKQTVQTRTFHLGVLEEEEVVVSLVGSWPFGDDDGSGFEEDEEDGEGEDGFGVVVVVAVADVAVAGCLVGGEYVGFVLIDLMLLVMVLLVLCILAIAAAVVVDCSGCQRLVEGGGSRSRRRFRSMMLLMKRLVRRD